MKTLLFFLLCLLSPSLVAAEPVPGMPPASALAAPASGDMAPASTKTPMTQPPVPAPPSVVTPPLTPPAAPALTSPPAQMPVSASALTPAPSSAPAPQWQPLLQRLAADGISGPDVDALFARMGMPTQDPMGRKVQELYTRKFVPPPPRDPLAPPRPKRTVYKNVITAENVQRCRQFLRDHAPAFALAELRYQLPKEVAVSLLFVETRLGNFLGDASAAYTLASMAVSTVPEHISQWLPQLPGYEVHLDWMGELMPKRADWAYKELRALMHFARQNGSDPLAMPGSIYGAIGLCQFMPSNLDRYAVDGDGDGAVNLFVAADAIASLSNYLVKNGWKGNLTRPQQHKVLKSYNRIDIYANTILVLSEAVAGRRPAVSPDDPPPAAPAQPQK